MQLIAPDDIDFKAYEWQTQCRAKVRSVTSYADALARELAPKARAHDPSMFSTKLRHFLQFRPSEVTAWAGYSGHRKSMFTGQLALELGLQGIRTLVMSFEMTPAQTLARMVRQFSGKAQPSDSDIAEFLQATEGRIWLFDHVGRIAPAEALAVCSYFAKEFKGQQVFVDSFMMVCSSEERMDEQKQFATDLVRLAQDTELHVHIIAHCRKPASGDETNPPGKHDLRGTAAITDQCPNVVTVWANKAKQAALEKDENDAFALQKPDALLTVCKQRHGSFEGRVSFWFDAPSLRFCDDQSSNLSSWAQRRAPARCEFSAAASG